MRAQRFLARNKKVPQRFLARNKKVPGRGVLVRHDDQKKGRQGASECDRPAHKGFTGTAVGTGGYETSSSDTAATGSAVGAAVGTAADGYGSVLCESSELPSSSLSCISITSGSSTCIAPLGLGVNGTVPTGW